MKEPAKTLQFSADIWIFSKQIENCDSLDNKWVFDFVITMIITIDIRIWYPTRIWCNVQYPP